MKEITGGNKVMDKHFFPDTLHPRKEVFIRAYVELGGRVATAAQAVGISRWTHYYWLKNDPEYAQLFDRAQSLAVDTLREEVIRRGKDGFEEPVFYQGQEVARVKKYSDNLLMFEVKRRDPAYRDNHQVAIQTNVNVQSYDLTGLTREELQQLRTLQAKALQTRRE